MPLGERSGPYGIVYEPCSFILLFLSPSSPAAPSARCFRSLCLRRFSGILLMRDARLDSERRGTSTVDGGFSNSVSSDARSRNKCSYMGRRDSVYLILFNLLLTARDQTDGVGSNFSSWTSFLSSYCNYLERVIISGYLRVSWLSFFRDLPRKAYLWRFTLAGKMKSRWKCNARNFLPCQTFLRVNARNVTRVTPDLVIIIPNAKSRATAIGCKRTTAARSDRDLRWRGT